VESTKARGLFIFEEKSLQERFWRNACQGTTGRSDRDVANKLKDLSLEKNEGESQKKKGWRARRPGDSEGGKVLRQ